MWLISKELTATSLTALCVPTRLSFLKVASFELLFVFYFTYMESTLDLGQDSRNTYDILVHNFHRNVYVY